MSTVLNVFGQYISAELMEKIKMGKVNSINVNKQSQSMTVTVLYDSLVPQADILVFEKELSRILELSSVRVNTVFPPETFRYIPGLFADWIDV